MEKMENMENPKKLAVATIAGGRYGRARHGR